MTGRHGAGKDQLYGNSLLLSPISFEDRAAAVASIIGKPCKVALYVKIEVVQSRNKLVRQRYNRCSRVSSEPWHCASTCGASKRTEVSSLIRAASSSKRSTLAKARKPSESQLPANR